MPTPADKPQDSADRSPLKSIEHHIEHAFNEVWQELSKLVHHDSKDGGNGKSDMAAATKQLQKDGVLPDVKIEGGQQKTSEPELPGEQATCHQLMHMLEREHGLTSAGAAGVVGNMMQENRLNTEFNQGGAGLCQWIGSRKQDLVDFAHSIGQSPSSVHAQVGFMMHELSTQYPDLLHELKTTHNARQAATHFCQQFERAGKPMIHNRVANAQASLQGKIT